MNFIPYLKINLQTKLNEKAVCEIIEKNTEPTLFFRSSIFKRDNTKMFEGEINGSYFSIRKIYRSRSIFVPQIIGNIENYFGTSTINLKFRIQRLTLGVYILCLAGMIVGIFSSIFSNNSSANSDAFTPLIFMFIAYIVIQLYFNYFTSNAKKALMKITEAYENEY